MAISLSVVVALLLFLPGAMFVLGLTKLTNTSTPETVIEQHFSIGVAIAVVVACVANILWFFAVDAFCRLLMLPAPDLRLFFSLLAGDSSVATINSFADSFQRYSLRILSYFGVLTFFCWRLGLKFNERLPNPPVDWTSLLIPKDKGVSFTWLTVEIEIAGTAYLFAGPVFEFTLDRNGGLDRIQFVYAAKKILGTPHPLSVGVSEAVEAEEDVVEGKVLIDGWIEIPGESMVLQVAASKTFNIDYIYFDRELRSDEDPPEEFSEDETESPLQDLRLSKSD